MTENDEVKDCKVKALRNKLAKLMSLSADALYYLKISYNHLYPSAVSISSRQVALELLSRAYRLKETIEDTYYYFLSEKNKRLLEAFIQKFEMFDHEFLDSFAVEDTMHHTRQYHKELEDLYMTLSHEIYAEASV